MIRRQGIRISGLPLLLLLFALYVLIKKEGSLSALGPLDLLGFPFFIITTILYVIAGLILLAIVFLLLALVIPGIIGALFGRRIGKHAHRFGPFSWTSSTWNFGSRRGDSRRGQENTKTHHALSRKAIDAFGKNDVIDAEYKVEDNAQEKRKKHH